MSTCENANRANVVLVFSVSLLQAREPGFSWGKTVVRVQLKFYKMVEALKLSTPGQKEITYNKFNLVNFYLILLVNADSPNQICTYQ